MTNFHVGQMVVVVRPGSKNHGRVVTIAGFCTRPHSDGGVGLFIEEFSAVATPTICGCYHTKYFRPVKPTSIQIFRKLVAPIKGEKVT